MMTAAKGLANYEYIITLVHIGIIIANINFCNTKITLANPVTALSFIHPRCFVKIYEVI